MEDRGLVMNVDSATLKVAQDLTPPYFATEEQALDHWSLWYNGDVYLLQSLIIDAQKVKGASVRAMIATEKTGDIPWMRIVYDDCTGESCVIRNYAHIEPQKRGKQWRLKPHIYPDAFKINIIASSIILKPPQELPPAFRNYVQQYYALATEHQRRYGIPWSVKLAQAILESSAGNSRLAKIGHQHFAIKAWDGWKGSTIRNKDEGTKKWKFVTHASDAESWEFHSFFLKKWDRYNGVFNYKPDSVYQYTFKPLAADYWKKGFKPVFHQIKGKIVKLQPGVTYTLSGLDCVCIELSRAGYATDYHYSVALMKIIKSISQKYPPN